jgi:hypothetical protein
MAARGPPDEREGSRTAWTFDTTGTRRIAMVVSESLCAATCDACFDATRRDVIDRTRADIRGPGTPANSPFVAHDACLSEHYYGTVLLTRPYTSLISSTRSADQSQPFSVNYLKPTGASQFRGFVPFQARGEAVHPCDVEKILCRTPV